MERAAGLVVRPDVLHEAAPELTLGGEDPAGDVDLPVVRLARDHAPDEGQELETAVEAGMQEKAREFREAGGEIYVPEIAKS